MNKKNLLFPAFVLVALVQLYVPARMIIDQELVLKTGTAYKFKTAPIDPHDPFRGKYLTLQFEANMIPVPDESDWLMGETVYVVLEEDSLGFAVPRAGFRERPTEGQEYVRATVSYVLGDSLNQMVIDYPFDRFYLEESKAWEAEMLYTEAQIDSSQVAYALVFVKEGKAVLKDVVLDGVPILEIIINERAGQ